MFGSRGSSLGAPKLTLTIGRSGREATVGDELLLTTNREKDSAFPLLAYVRTGRLRGNSGGNCYAENSDTILLSRGSGDF